MGLLDKIFGGGEGAAAKAAMKAAQKGMTYFNPYYTGGQQAYGNVQNYLNKMEDPAAYYDSIMSQYAPSAAYQNKLNRGMDVLNNNAAQNGTFGMGGSQKEIMDYLIGLINEDEQTYYNNVNNVGNQYLSGEKYLTDMGYDSAGQLATLQGAYGKAKGDKSRASSNALNNMIGTALHGFADYRNGGFNGMMQPYSSDYRLGGGGGGQSTWLNPDTMQRVPGGPGTAWQSASQMVPMIF